MKLSNYNKKADEYTAKASDIIRQMLLGAIALIWLFKEINNGISRIDYFLLFPLITVSLGLICDLLQYVVGGKVWKDFFIQKEKEHRNTNDPDPDIKAPRKYNAPVYVLYMSKVVLMVSTYLLIVYYLWTRINFN